MYCSTCGVTVAQGLSFCKHCGAKLSAENGDGLAGYSELKAESFLISAMVVVFILGLGVIMGLMAVMKNGIDLEAPQIIPFAILSFLMLFIIEGVIVWRMMRRDRLAKASVAATAPPSEQTTKELDAARARSLAEGMPPSVTEHTTRAFEPIYTERKSG
jgi:hypothetical protein